MKVVSLILTTLISVITAKNCQTRGQCCSDPNEEYLVSGFEYTCKDLDSIEKDPGAAGCFCKSGYVRNEGKCILKDECPLKCSGSNEIYCESACACDPDYTCDGRIYNNTQQYPKCHCEKGYVRDDNGKCIPKSECPSICDGPNEIHDVTGRDYTCDNIPHNPTKDDCCYCKPGYVRDKKDICIPKDKCPPQCKGPNEIHPENQCGCGPDYTCCGLIYNNTQGYPKCHCEKGYVRDDNGKCIPKSECQLMCDGPNEIHDVTGRDYTCDNIPHNPTKDDCCYCEPGYVRDKNDICIPKDKCPPQCKGPNEIHPDNQCGCGPDYTCCGLIYNNTQGYPKCHCEKGYVRDDNGKCIPKSECPSMCDGPNEIHDVTGRDYTCDNIPHNPTKDDCCYCKPGYVRDKNDICIPKDKCPPQCKGPNEIHPDNQCGCGPDYTCWGLIYNNTQGYPKCHCKKGHVRDNDGKCIPKGQCPPKCSGPNEVYKDTGCDDTCDGPPCKPNNRKGCYCLPGHVRNMSGKCIPKSKCPPKCTGPNAVYKEMGCDNTCNGPPCKPINRKGCYCLPGHVRNTSGKCIPKGKCPPKCSGPNAVYKEIGCDNTCNGPPCKPINRKGCYCILGHVRNSSGKCISKRGCPPKCNGPNEVHKAVGFDYTCGGKTCITSHPKTGKGCYCKDGYIRNAAGKCILKANCPR